MSCSSNSSGSFDNTNNCPDDGVNEKEKKSNRGKGWKKNENVLYMKAFEQLCLHEDIPETDGRWTNASKLVVENPHASMLTGSDKYELRGSSAIRDHLKEMVKTVRSVSSEYSKEREAIICPPAKKSDGSIVDFGEDEEFKFVFREYTNALHKFYNDIWADNIEMGKRSKCSRSWWNEEVFYEVRKFCFTRDNKKVLDEKAKKDKAPSKMEQEAQAQKEFMEERKRKKEQEEKDDIERKKTLVSSVERQTEALNGIASSFGLFVNGFGTPLQGHTSQFLREGTLCNSNLLYNMRIIILYYMLTFQ